MVSIKVIFMRSTFMRIAFYTHYLRLDFYYVQVLQSGGFSTYDFTQRCLRSVRLCESVCGQSRATILVVEYGAV